jgi:hypothetical protein
MIVDLQSMPLNQIIIAVGGLGTAAFGLVETAKPVFGGINRIGLEHIQEVVAALTPEESSASSPANALAQADILNGADVANQRAIAKSLIKLHLSADNALAVALKASVDAALLSAVAAKMANGTPLSQEESDVYARFDMIVTALLDEAYQISDQDYRNWTRLLASGAAVLLAVAGGWEMAGTSTFWHSSDPFLALLVGLLATPLAPIAKDLSTALATAVNVLQLVKK